MSRAFISFDDFSAKGRELAALRPVVTVGNFDGVHLGHQYLVAELIEWARREHAPSIAVTFSVHPRELVTGNPMPALTTPEHKRRLLTELGVDAVVLVDFDRALQQRSARDFMDLYIKGRLNARAMLVGFNNRIGKDGEGTTRVLAEIGREIGVDVREAERIEVSGHAMSSSAIRNHVAHGDFLWARKMLGRPYSIVGVVQHGDQRGGKIGFPTANIDLAGLAFPPQGVYGVRLRLSGKNYLGAANIGTRPTVDPARTTPLLEVHVLDFSGDLYGKEVEVEFLFKVRDEQKFSGLDALKAQLAKDVSEIRTRAAQEGLT
ncbi:MAG: riboflavin biosynthesis protein RibF [Planctomycetes bacterium]|nr:riboflavin biosynthesis protein RibF [Planctomycetota bacterium]